MNLVLVSAHCFSLQLRVRFNIFRSDIIMKTLCGSSIDDTEASDPTLGEVHVRIIDSHCDIVLLTRQKVS